MNPELVVKVLAKFVEELPGMMRRAQTMVKLADPDVRRALEDFGYKYISAPRARYNVQLGEWALENRERGMNLYYVQAVAGGGKFGLFLRVGTRGENKNGLIALAYEVSSHTLLRVQIQTDSGWEDYHLEVYPANTWLFWGTFFFCGSVGCLIAFCIRRRKMRKQTGG
jgi:hypothetical protein